MSSKISALTTGTTASTADKIPIERGGANYYLTPPMVRARPVTSTAISASLTSADMLGFILVTAADKVITLPAASSSTAGMMVTVALSSAGLSASTGLQVSPAAADKIMGNGITSADNKDLILSGATDREGDSVTLICDGVDGWYIAAIVGTWAREA